MEPETTNINEIYLFWYGHPLKLLSGLNFKTIKPIDFPESHLEYLWKHVWFAKNEDQKIMDIYLKKFEHFYEITYDLSQIDDFFKEFSLIILYDQISRNIYRNSAKAYEFDEYARSLARKYKTKLKELALHNILTILICFLHSENKEDQIFVGDSIKWLKIKYGMQHNEIIDHLALIHKNHYERIMMFGRIPERNKFLGRDSTEAEIIYIKSVDSSK